eukprot:CAMPEP_0119079996 /NCGR_PEP_ID=MMETSP1178-20130426/110089_1 /TAXON_ID=33656 /ORGANISM="unid sp, Strain CCMP2000" /LENGTH=59 /DNA_ID=CAMNT_0007062557 /DNA_START=92 /DNA_END=268 /DNA_ORIENTATION=-
MASFSSYDRGLPVTGSPIACLPLEIADAACHEASASAPFWCESAMAFNSAGSSIAEPCH